MNENEMREKLAGNKLLTQELLDRMDGYPLYSQDGKRMDASCRAMFYLGGVRWYILEGGFEGGDYVMFGIVLGLVEPEYGYISLNELAQQSIPFNIEGREPIQVPVFMDEDTEPCELSELTDDKELQDFLHRLWDKDDDKDEEETTTTNND